jgi:outer membrane protein assembly factor BamB
MLKRRCKEKMKSLKESWTKAFMVTLVLSFIIGFSLTALPIAYAQETVTTYPFINAIPNPVGVNQEVLLHVGITMPLYSAGMGWEGLWVEIKRPDDQTVTITDIKTDSTGGTGVTYKPPIAGNYSLKLHFPEQVTTSTKIAGSMALGVVYPAGTVFAASETDWLILVVTQEPRQFYPGFPLPSEYWTRPIDAQIREWSTIAGNWLDASNRNPQVVTGNDYAPETPHILWTKQLTTGGLVGAPLNESDVGFENGDAYEGKWQSRVILAGKLYYTDAAANDRWKRTVCVDLHTGEELWKKTLLDNRTITFAQTMYWKTANNQGVFDYLWVVVGSTYYAFDPFTGDWVYTMTNVPSGTRVFGPKGEILIYTLSLTRGYMTLWNSSNVADLWGSKTAYTALSWRPQGKIVNATGPIGTTAAPWNATLVLGLNGYMWNKTIPTGLPGSALRWFALDRVVGGYLTRKQVVFWSISLKPDDEGTLLYNASWTPPAEWDEGDLTIEFETASVADGVMVLWTKENRQHYGFSIEDGQYLWGPTPSEHYLNYYGWTAFGERAPMLAYGRLYSTGVSGILYCYNATTGTLLWTYTASQPYNEILWNNAWWLHPLFITDGKIYLGSTEHSANQPLPRGAPLICLNATTGDEIFRVDGLCRQTWWGGIAIIGDSIIASMDTYDQRIYAIGKGPTVTTVEAPLTGIPLGSSIVIKGTVMDISPGTRDIAIQLRFPNGVPAVADEDMGDWMLYVYKQFPRPTDVQGVWVKLDAINVYTGEYLDIGGTHTDSTGMFCVSWNPPKEGLWTILATFPGSKSYYPSFAETAITVTSAMAGPAGTLQSTIEALQPWNMALTVLVVIAIIIGIYSIYDHRKLKK